MFSCHTLHSLLKIFLQYPWQFTWVTMEGNQDLVLIFTVLTDCLAPIWSEHMHSQTVMGKIREMERNAEALPTKQIWYLQMMTRDWSGFCHSWPCCCPTSPLSKLFCLPVFRCVYLGFGRQLTESQTKLQNQWQLKLWPVLYEPISWKLQGHQILCLFGEDLLSTSMLHLGSFLKSAY